MQAEKINTCVSQHQSMCSGFVQGDVSANFPTIITIIHAHLWGGRGRQSYATWNITKAWRYGCRWGRCHDVMWSQFRDPLAQYWPVQV